MINKIKLKTLALSIGSVTAFVMILVLLTRIKHFIPEKFERYAHGIVGLIASLTTVWLFIKYEKSTFKKFGLHWNKSTLKKFLLGLLAGLVLGSIMILSQVIYSGLEITLSENYNIPTFLLWSSALIPLAFMEEIAFRSYPFIKLNKVFGLRITQIIIALLFALYHVLNGWSIGLAFLGPGIWALAYGLAAIISDGISMPIGLHYGVNLVLALISSQNGIEGIWIIDFPNDVTEATLIANENFGIIIHLILLAFCIIGTVLYLRKKKITANTVYN